MGSGPARCRIGRRDELGCDLARSAECRVIEYGQILLDRTSRGSPFSPSIPLLPVRIRLDQADIDRKAFAADQTLADAAPQDRLKWTP
jgi:hypothetical protein